MTTRTFLSACSNVDEISRSREAFAYAGGDGSMHEEVDVRVNVVELQPATSGLRLYRLDYCDDKLIAGCIVPSTLAIKITKRPKACSPRMCWRSLTSHAARWSITFSLISDGRSQ
jgi:hypothetical protein